MTSYRIVRILLETLISGPLPSRCDQPVSKTSSTYGTYSTCVTSSSTNNTSNSNTTISQHPTSLSPFTQAGRQFVMSNLVLSRRNLHKGRWWTTLTFTLMHSSPSHLFSNMCVLWSLGPPVIVEWGVTQFVTLWLGGALTGSAATVWNGVEEVVDVGASGALMAIMAAEVCGWPWRHKRGLMLVSYSSREEKEKVQSRVDLS